MNYGGDCKWLDSRSNVPNKFQKIIDICLEFAYKPWSLRSNPIILQSIMKGVDSWSKQELGQAFVIIAFYHSLCGLVYAMGLLPEVPKL